MEHGTAQNNAAERKKRQQTSPGLRSPRLGPPRRVDVGHEGMMPATSAQGAEDERQATGWPGQPRIPADSERGLYDRCVRDVKPATRSPSKPITETGAVAAGELSSDGQDVGAALE